MGNWSMKTDRQLLTLARADESAEGIARKLDKPVASVLKAAKRLGLELRALPVKRGRKAYGKAK